MHGSPLRVSSQPEARLVLLPRVLDRLGRNIDFADPDFVAVIHGGRASERQKQHGGHTRLLLTDTSADAGLIVADSYGGTLVRGAPLHALTAARRATGFVGIPVPPLQFLAVPLFDMALFATFTALAIAKRRDAQSHKRWMLLATINLVTAAIARWPLIGAFGPPAYFGLTDVFVVALAVWDIRTRGRLHPATLWGGLSTIISQPLRLIVSGTPAWLEFARFATGLPG